MISDFFFTIFIELRKHHHNFRADPPYSPNQPQATTRLLSESIYVPILDSSYKWSNIICGFLKNNTFTWHNVWRFINIVAYIRILFLFMTKEYSIIWTHFVHLFIRWWKFELFLLCRYYNNIAVNIHVQIFMYICFCFSWVYTEQWDFWIIWWLTFKLLRNCQNVFQSGCLILCPH